MSEDAAGGGVPLLTPVAEKGTFTLYPVFESPEDEYKYISWRMAELERQLGHDKVKVKEKTRKKVGKKEKKLPGEAKDGKKKRTKKTTRKSTRKAKGKNDQRLVSEASDTSREQDRISAGKEKEVERDAAMPEELGRIDSEMKGPGENGEVASSDEKGAKPRLRKAASFLFNKTSDVRAYLRRMSADIRDMATAREMEPAQEEASKEMKRTKAKKKKEKEKKRRSAHEARHSTSSAGVDLNDMKHDEEELSYDARYTDAAVFVFASRNTAPHHSRHFNASDHETFSIMIEEDSTTYDSPSMLPVAMPEVEIDIELDEEDTHSLKSSGASSLPKAALSPPSSSSSSSSSFSSASIMVRVPSPSPSLASKASYRMTMPPIPPSAVRPPHPASGRVLQHSLQQQPIEQVPPYRSGWAALRPLPPVPIKGQAVFAHSSGSVPTPSRIRTGTCIY